MPFNVFFAWQMDTATKLNRWFIETAIKSAIKRITDELRQEGAADLKLEPALPVESDEPNEANPDPDPADGELLYQWGAHGLVGASMIAETILQRIEACGVFIADLTLTANVQTDDGRAKKVPNANVLIEVGAASRTGQDWDRMILVMNTQHGEADELPFDLKHRQCQVRYTLANWDDPDRSKKLKQLADDIALQLRPMYHTAVKRTIEERRKAEAAELAALQDKKEKAAAERTAYENKLLSQSYKPNFKETRGLLTVTVLPAKPQTVPLQSDADDYFFQKRLAPIGYDRGEVKHDMNSELCFWPSEDKPSRLIAELNYGTGSIYSVRALLYHDPKPHPFRFLTFEPQFTNAVQRYMNTLKELGLKGPYFVGISLLNMRGFKISLTDWDDDDWRIGDNDLPNIQTHLLTLMPDVDTSKEEVVAEFLKPAFRQIWRAFHLPGRPNLKPDGTFQSYDG